MIQNGGICTKRSAKSVKIKMNVRTIVNIKNLCKLYVIKSEEGIVKVKRMNVNARLPVRGQKVQRDMTWLQHKLQ